MVNFGFIWWLFFLGVVSFMVPKALKFRLYNINILFKSFYNNLNGIFLCFYEKSVLFCLKLFKYNKKLFSYFFFKK
jgi:hypothetical protein